MLDEPCEGSDSRRLRERPEQREFRQGGIGNGKFGRPGKLAVGRPDLNHGPRPGRAWGVVEGEPDTSLVDHEGLYCYVTDGEGRDVRLKPSGKGLTVYFDF